MASDQNSWNLFGYDLGFLWSRYVGAWHEVFWHYSSAVRQWLDERVIVVDSDETDAGTISGQHEKAVAYRLSNDDYLVREVNIPSSAQLTLKDVVEAEVFASSPFLPEDTVFGWTWEPNGTVVRVLIAIASKSAVMNRLHQCDLSIKSDSLEIWAAPEKDNIVLEGFGEAARNSRYKKRLLTFGALISISMISVVGGAAIPMSYKAHELSELNARYDEVNRAARSAVAMRSELALRNDLIDKLNTFSDMSVWPLDPLSALSEQMPDDSWLMAYVQQGRQVDLQGAADNAATLMQDLSQYPLFQDLTPTAAIRKVGRSEKENFQLKFFVPMREELR
ncbi:PilN domain-containing protein [Gilvimarinus japonicus]|uniref:PilN domain-containing protein n=1 Tax=Gilvimarinus japonicus TaxID=1796469 RepID=A0ABV7HVE3_9GAMM